jgi:hypothetical protein
VLQAGRPPRPPLCDIFGVAPNDKLAADPGSGFVWTVMPRHGRRPAAFLGRELLRADNAEAVRNGVRNEWSDIRIFELRDSGFVTSVRHLRADETLPRWQDAWESPDASAVVAALCAHDPELQGEAGRRAAWHDLLRAVFGSEPRA